jgi:ABC-type amino acid transport substrate-binding protein
MKKVNIPLLIVLAFLAGLFGAYAYAHLWNPAASSSSAAHIESSYDRVLRTGELRCGYAAWPPIIIKDPNSGTLSGIGYDFVEALGAALKLKIVWAEEVGWGDFPTALASGRIDAFCAGAWSNSSRARQVDFTLPILYQPVYAYARADDKRFDNNLDAINDPNVTIAAIDGEMASLIAVKDFPQAKTLQLAQLSAGSDAFLNVVDKKADIAFTDPATFGEYDAKNPGKLRRVISKAPLRVFGVPLAIAHGQDEFRRMLDTSTTELLSSGQIEKIIAKYEQYPGALLRVAPPYIPQ